MRSLSGLRLNSQPPGLLCRVLVHRSPSPSVGVSDGLFILSGNISHEARAQLIMWIGAGRNHIYDTSLSRRSWIVRRRSGTMHIARTKMRIMASRKAAWHSSRPSRAPRSSLPQCRDGIRHGAKEEDENRWHSHDGTSKTQRSEFVRISSLRPEHLA